MKRSAPCAILIVASAAACTVYTPPPQTATGQPPEVAPPQPAAPAYQPPAFTEADNARWLSSVRLGLVLPKHDYVQGEPVFAQVTLSNASGQHVPVHVLEPSAVTIAVTQGGREVARCRGGGAGTPPGNAYTLRAGQRVYADIALAQCGALGPGDYVLVAELDLPGPWSVAAQGRLQADAAIRVEPPRQAALTLALRVVGPPETLANGPAPLEAVVSNLGNAPGRVPGEGAVLLDVTDEMGQRAICPQIGGAPQVVVNPGQPVVLRIDAARRCNLARPGTFAVAARLPSMAGELHSNAVTLIRRAPVPRAQLQLFATTWGRYQPGRDLPVALRLRNDGPDDVYVYGFAPELLRVQAFGDGRPLPCNAAPPPDPRDQGRYALLRAGGELAGRVDLARMCALGGSHIEVRVGYVAGPPYDGRPWGLQAWTGEVAAAPVLIEAIPVPVALPHVSVRFPPRVQGPVGGSLLALVDVVNDGPVPATIVRPNDDAVRVNVFDPSGQPLMCGGGDRPYGPLDTLQPGEMRRVTVDLARRCRFSFPGEYRAEVHYRTAGEGPAIGVEGGGQMSVGVGGAMVPPPTAAPPHVTLTFPGQVRARYGGPVTMEIALRNDGGSPAFLPGPNGQWVTPEIRDRYGGVLACRRLPQNFMPVRVRLDPGQTTTGSFDLAAFCTFPGPGAYRAQLRYETDGAGMTPVTGVGTTMIDLLPTAMGR